MSWPQVNPPWANVKWQYFYPPGIPTKFFTLHMNPQWSEEPCIESTSEELRRLKQQIEVLDKRGEWEFLKRTSNPYELVFSQTHDKRIPSSVCSLKPFSRSFFKMIEILHVMEFFKRRVEYGKKPVIRSAHVCEGPGGFIEALLHLSMRNSFQLEDSWAMTLKPTMPNIPGWKRAQTFIKNTPALHIEYGADNTGNIMNPLNQGAFLEKTRGLCDIFTADGGFDFSEHYNSQEEEVLPLLVSSIIIGLQTLVRGGDFVLKIFDTETVATTHIIALLGICFDRWTLYKPGLSRPCNAEKYFLGSGYRIAPGYIFKILVEIRNAYACGFKHIQYIFTQIPSDIIEDISIIKNEHLQQQIAALKYAISNKVNWNLNYERQWADIKKHSIAWCKQFHMPLKNFGNLLDPRVSAIPWNQVVASHTRLTSAVRPV